jgi:predicted nucleic acid-binding protein
VSDSVQEFLDANILVYAFSTDPRSAKAERLLATGCTVSVQGLNEFANVARRKLGMSWRETMDALAVIRTLCARIVPINLETHETAMTLGSRHGFSIFNSVMLASALEAGCQTFWSEDMHPGMLIEDRLRIADPFA